MFAKNLLPFGEGLLREGLPHDGNQNLVVFLGTLRVGVKTGVEFQVLTFEDLAEGVPVSALLQETEAEPPAVFGLVVIPEGAEGGLFPHAPGLFLVKDVALDIEGGPVDLAAEQCGVDLLPDAMPLPGDNGIHYAECQQNSVFLVGHAAPERNWPIRVSVALNATEELGGNVVDGLVLVGARNAHAGGDCVDELVVGGGESRVVEAQVGEGGYGEIGEEYVGAANQVAYDFKPGFGVVIEGYAALVAVVVFKVVGEGERLFAGGLAADVAAGIAEVLVLDLYYVGAHVGEEGAGHGPLLAGSELDDRNTFKDHGHGLALLGVA